MSTGLCPDCNHPWDEHAPAMVWYKPKPGGMIYSEGFDSYRQPESSTCRTCGCKTARLGTDPWFVGPLLPVMCDVCGRQAHEGELGWITKSEKIIGQLFNEVRFLLICPVCQRGTEL